MTEAIEDANEKAGVSRQQIKKFAESRYGLQGTAVNSHLATAIKRGAEAGKFVLPKGASGRVKLAKAAPAAGKSARTSAIEDKKPCVRCARRTRADCAMQGSDNRPGQGERGQG